jgi:hypothetical protein
VPSLKGQQIPPCALLFVVCPPPPLLTVVPCLLLCLQGWDKTYCLQFVDKEFDDIHFFGDKTFQVGGKGGGGTATCRSTDCVDLQGGRAQQEVSVVHAPASRKGGWAQQSSSLGCCHARMSSVLHVSAVRVGCKRMRNKHPCHASSWSQWPQGQSVWRPCRDNMALVRHVQLAELQL